MRAQRDIFMWIVLATVFFLPLQIPLEGLVRFAPSDALMVLAFPLLLTRLSFMRQSTLVAPLLFPVIMLYGAFIGGVVNGEVLMHALVAKVIGAFVLFISFITWSHAARISYQNLLDMIRALLLGSVVFSIIGLVEFSLDTSIITERFIESRFAGGYYDPNHYGALTGVGIVLLAALSKDLYRSQLTVAIIGSLLIAGLLLSISRGAWVATAIGLAVVVIKRPIRIKPGLILFVLTVFVAVAMSGVIEILLGDINQRPDNVSHRMELIMAGYTRLQEVGFMGIGLSAFLNENEIIIHNSAAWMLVEMGVFGLLVYILFVMEPAIKLLRLRRNTLAMGSSLRTRIGRISAALLAAHLLMSIASLNVEATYQRQWWFILALTVALLTLNSIKANKGIRVTRENGGNKIHPASVN